MNMTTWIFIALAQLVGAIDLCLLATRGPEATFSAAILAGSRAYPIVPFLAGVLAGHLFFPQPWHQQ